MEQTAVHPRAGWSEAEVDRLWREVRAANEKGLPLRAVFEQMGEELGRKPNSVRNYYYMQLRPQDGTEARRAAPFETFSEDEVRALVRDVLLARSRGQSVRAAVTALSGGDRARMLRYQNKYRAVLKKRPRLVEDVREELRAEGIECPDPLGAAPGETEALRREAERRAEALNDPAVHQLLGGLNALLDRALEADPQTGRDRRRVRLELMRLQYDGLCRAAGDLVLLCKEYLGRGSEGPSFSQEDAEALRRCVSAVENAMRAEGTIQ